jgi:hypothetical protein
MVVVNDEKVCRFLCSDVTNQRVTSIVTVRRHKHWSPAYRTWLTNVNITVSRKKPGRGLKSRPFIMLRPRNRTVFDYGSGDTFLSGSTYEARVAPIVAQQELPKGTS